MTTSVVPSAGAGTRPVATAQAPRAIVPWPQAVEKPSLCQKRAPRWAPASSGGTRKAPYMSAWPRGSPHSRARVHCTPASAMAAVRRSATVGPCPVTAGGDAGTIRNGSPPVCQSTVSTGPVYAVPTGTVYGSVVIP